MEDNFRNTLIIISAVVIAAIFIHGYWTIRKQKNPYKLKAKNEPVVSESRGFDGSGFDQDGVSKVKVVGNNPRHEEISAAHTVDDSTEFHTDEPLPESVPMRDFEDKEQGLNFGALLDETEEIPEHLKQQALSKVPDYDEERCTIAEDNTIEETIIEENIEPVQERKPLYEQPVTQAKPEMIKTSDVKATVKKKNTRKRTEKTVKRNQMDFNFGDELIDDTDMPSISAVEKKEPIVEIESQVIVLSVVMPEGQSMSGAALLPTLLTLGMKYGEMNIFHRHQDNAGNGKVTFSLANMMNPGTFDLDDIENFTTQGITLFMTLPNAGDAFAVFEQMLNAAKQLALEFHGQLLDDKRNVMTKQTEQHYSGMIREFERKSRIGTL